MLLVFREVQVSENKEAYSDDIGTRLSYGDELYEGRKKERKKPSKECRISGQIDGHYIDVLV